MNDLCYVSHSQWEKRTANWLNTGVTASNDELERAAVSQMSAAFVTNAPAPYRDQLYRSLVSHFRQVNVYYCDPPKGDRSWRIDEGCESARLKTVASIGAAGSFQPGVVGAVRRADVIYVGGYETVTYVLAMLAGRLSGRRVVLFFDGIAPSRLSRRGVKYWLKRLIVRLPHVCLVNGTVGRIYFHDALKVPVRRLRNQYLVPVSEAPSAVDVAPVDVLFVGRLIERKGVGDLIEALRRAPELSAVVVGDGPLRARFEEQAAWANVRFVGELDRSDVAAWMKAAKCLVVPSRDEPWGLVVHEAVQSGIPVVASDDVGAALDLVVDGTNGVIVRVGDVAALCTALHTAIGLDRVPLSRMNERLLAEWSIDSYVSAFLGAASC